MLDLCGLWHLSDQVGHSIDMTLPGDAITALHAAGAIPDPYFGRNEMDLRWIAERDWVLRRSFSVPRTDMVLVIEMLDTVAQVRVNGDLVLSADNMFRSHRIDVSAALRPGANDIEITFPSSVAEAARRQAAQHWPVPYNRANSVIPDINTLRKQQCDFGWDWNIALAPFGLYGAIRLEPAVVARISGITVAQVHAPDLATLTVTALIDGDAEGETVRIAFGTETVDAVVVSGRAEAVLTIPNPALWWPAGQGAQVLHDLTVTLGAQVEMRRIGLRSVELVTEKDVAGTGFKLRVNGRDIFAKGANWIPADALAGRITVEATRDLLQSAVDVHMNMIRVWGGGRYEPAWFHDLCDQMGLMVWQDFMFSCHIYPADTGFLADVAQEVREQALRLHHHASMVLWCGDNELIGALTWFPETRANRDLYLVAYDRLNRTIETALRQTVPAAVWWPSSPSPGPMNFGDAWHDDSTGDMHFWSVWHEGRDFDHYRDVSPRFCSEFGFQSYPSLDVIRRFADPADMNIASPVMEAHQKNAGGNARIAETMFRYFRFPVDFANFVYLSQVQQGLAIKTAVTHWRSLKPHCMGALYWQLNDTWPVCSWSSLDHGGGWKLLHHMAKRFFAPVLVTVVPQPGGYAVRGVNDNPGPVAITLELNATDMAGRIRPLSRQEATLGADAQELAHLPADALAPGEMMVLLWTLPDGSRHGDVFAPKPWKSYDLLPAAVTHTVEPDGPGWRITLTARNLALFVAVEADCPGRFGGNAVALFPDHPASITFTPATPGPAPTFTIRDLHSATYGQA